MSYTFTVPADENPGFSRHLMMMATSLLRFLAPAIYCRSWAPWWRLIITVVVVIVLIIVGPLLGQLLPVNTM